MRAWPTDKEAGEVAVLRRPGELRVAQHRDPLLLVFHSNHLHKSVASSRQKVRSGKRFFEIFSGAGVRRSSLLLGQRNYASVVEGNRAYSAFDSSLTVAQRNNLKQPAK